MVVVISDSEIINVAPSSTTILDPASILMTEFSTVSEKPLETVMVPEWDLSVSQIMSEEIWFSCPFTFIERAIIKAIKTAHPVTRMVKHNMKKAINITLSKSQLSHKCLLNV